MASSRVTELLANLTLEEKVYLLSGSDNWRTFPVPRLGIPAVKVTDGPIGARGDSFNTGQNAACFPAPIAMASTWDTDLLLKVGSALGEEAKSKAAQVLLAPTINMHRSPLNGRNFECYSEDPFLTGKMATAFVSGLQSQGVAAAVKHFACNDSEFERDSISSEITERPFREIYLRPFEMVVRDADPWCIMTSYNKINGVFASENPKLLKEILRNEWNWKGMVMSDWFGVKSTVPSVLNGNDLEMPGPPAWRGEKLLAAIKQGELKEEDLNESVQRVLSFVERVGKFEDPEERPETYLAKPEITELIRNVSADSIILVKNEQSLPLNKDALKSVAIIGPNAKTAVTMGGGSSKVQAPHEVTPYEGIAAALGEDVDIRHSVGAYTHKLIPQLDDRLQTPDGELGYIMDVYESKNFGETPTDSKVLNNTRVIIHDAGFKDVDFRSFSAKVRARYTAKHTGPHTFGIASVGLSKLYVDGKLVIDNWTSQVRGDIFFGFGSREEKAQYDMIEGQTYEILIDYMTGHELMAMLRFGLLEPLASDVVEQAVKVAEGTDVAVVVVGLNNEWETEGYDKTELELPGGQNELIEAVANVNKNTIVVVQCGSPVVMPWIDKVSGVIVAWYGGQETGHSIADVLFGKVNPSGRLTQTFPKRLEDNPAFDNYPGENGKVIYGEGLFIGYRYYQRRKVDVFLPFGFGLSYTTFDYGNIKLDNSELDPQAHITVSVDVTNTGSIAGKEVVQVYVHDNHPRLSRPLAELKGFSKVELAPGETRTVQITLDKHAVAFYDDKEAVWVAEAGEFELHIGSSSADIRGKVPFTVTKSLSWTF
ncbi:hypothetical protein BZG36_05039 [Bifiguratus adelaidae]|uniref:beta-glucosidase n=1 Tax=Bifiguratus adelaidae TaxID=1938954 RepID=A0A261XUH4_9FUNG|nr:hypothetical protein BZG36_05039 [Bifiguratus adelaidae]